VCKLNYLSLRACCADASAWDAAVFHVPHAQRLAIDMVEESTTRTHARHTHFRSHRTPNTHNTHLGELNADSLSSAFGAKSSSPVPADVDFGLIVDLGLELAPLAGPLLPASDAIFGQELPVRQTRTKAKSRLFVTLTNFEKISHIIWNRVILMRAIWR
jgi:hypothetical protein